MQDINPPKITTPSTTEFQALAQLSPVGGSASVVLIVTTLSAVGGLLFATPLYPLVGVIGTFLAIVGGACVAERLIRPLVLCAVGFYVFKTLVNVWGTQTADEIARLCGKGRAPTAEQLAALMGRLPHRQVPGSGGRV